MSGAIFVVDIASCTGCGTCSIACKDRSGLPDDLDFLSVEEHEGGIYPEPTLHYRVIHCFHCAQPACAAACPVEAISKEEDGLVVINADECTGCGECITACPFDAIVMLSEDIAAKCDSCADEVARGWRPTCVRACSMRALSYVPMEDAQLEKRFSDPDFRDHGIGPGVLYLLREQ
ncbi:4Fe-4S dicluster domain-containing protein [Candidatus Poribacteria bacterium]